MESTGLSVIPDEEHNPISENKYNRKNAEDFLRWSIDCCHALNSPMLCGPFHQPLGQFSGNPPTQEEKERGAKVHQIASDYAKKFNINKKTNKKITGKIEFVGPICESSDKFLSRKYFEKIKK